jgi:dTMP kinase
MPLIVLEGIDGCGKTTQAERLVTALNADGRPARRLREPGGTLLGERLRSLLLDPATVACPTAELFTYLAARAQLVDEILQPALAKGEWLVLDRFWYSTVAYQGHGLGLDPAAVTAACRLAVGGLKPHAALWLDVPVAMAAARRASTRTGADRIEARGDGYQEQVRQGYAALTAAGELTRIDAASDADTVFARIWPLTAGTIAS